jgi:predicted enzyme related to lactoylglutathione lyase
LINLASHTNRQAPIVATIMDRISPPPVLIPTGAFAWMADPEGNIIGLWKPK